MSEIKSFSDYTSKYNSNVDFSALFSGTSDSSSVGNTNMLSDYAAIKNGSYGKLMKAYYAKQDAEKLSGKGDTSQKLTLMKTSADSLTKSADALNDSGNRRYYITAEINFPRREGLQMLQPLSRWNLLKASFLFPYLISLQC